MILFDRLRFFDRMIKVVCVDRTTNELTLFIFIYFFFLIFLLFFRMYKLRLIGRTFNQIRFVCGVFLYFVVVHFVLLTDHFFGILFISCFIFFLSVVK